MHFTIPDIVRVQVLEFMYSFSKFTNLFPEYNLNSLSIGIVCAYQKWSYSVRFGAKQQSFSTYIFTIQLIKFNIINY